MAPRSSPGPPERLSLGRVEASCRRRSCRAMGSFRSWWPSGREGASGISSVTSTAPWMCGVPRRPRSAASLSPASATPTPLATMAWSSPGTARAGTTSNSPTPTSTCGPSLVVTTGSGSAAITVSSCIVPAVSAVCTSPACAQFDQSRAQDRTCGSSPTTRRSTMPTTTGADSSTPRPSSASSSTRSPSAARTAICSSRGRLA